MENIKNSDLDINIENYSGPLDVLLELAKSQKVDLTKISVTELADQFLNFINSAKKLNLDIALEYLLMATWLTYLKSKLLLPDDDDDGFVASEVAEKLKIQLKKLELIRLLSDQLLQKKRLGVDIFLRGKSDGTKSIYNSKYSVTLFEVLKAYSNYKMKKDFLVMNIPKLPVYTTEQAIENLKNNFNKLNDWIEISKLIPKKFIKNKNFNRTGLAGTFAATLELSKEGSLELMQEKLFDKILVRGK